MALTLDDIVYLVRDQLKDSRTGNYRYSDALVMKYLNASLLDVKRLRPDLYLPNILTAAPSYDENDLGVSTDFPIDDTFATSVVDYIVGYISMSDDEFAVDGRAVAISNRFVQRLTGRGA